MTARHRLGLARPASDRCGHRRHAQLRKPHRRRVDPRWVRVALPCRIRSGWRVYHQATVHPHLAQAQHRFVRRLPCKRRRTEKSVASTEADRRFTDATQMPQCAARGHSVQTLPYRAGCPHINELKKLTRNFPIREPESPVAAVNGGQQVERRIVRHAAPFPVAVRHHRVQRRHAVSGEVRVRHKRRGRGGSPSGSTCSSAGTRCVSLEPLPTVLASAVSDPHDQRR